MFFFFDEKPFIAIIGDIRQSKQLKNRREVQVKLQQALDAVNVVYSNAIAAKFMITLGDEFQGLLNSGSYIMDIIDRIERTMYPVRLRFGIGAGAITTEINTSVPLGADGPAYYLARDAITELKASESRKMEPVRNTFLKLEKNTVLCNLLNSSFSLLTSIKENWTPRQVEIINAYIRGDGTQSDAAHMLRVDPSNVQKTLDKAKYYTYRSALDSISAVFAEIQVQIHV